MGKRGAGGIFAAAMLLSGCWTQIGGDASHTRFNGVDGGLSSSNVAQLDELWSATMAADDATEPVVAEGRVFTTRRHPTDGFIVTAFAATTGDPMWSSPVAGADDWAGAVAVSGDQLWVPTAPEPCSIHSLFRLDPASGSIVHSDQLVGHTPVVTGGGVIAYVGQDYCDPLSPSRLVVLDAETRNEIWSFTFPNVAPGTSTVGDQMPTIADGRIYVAHADTLYAFAADGCDTSPCPPIWWHPFPEETLLAPMALPGGQVVVASNATDESPASGQWSIHGVDGATGPAGGNWWHGGVGVVHSTVGTEHTVYVALENDAGEASLRMIDTFEGALVWSKTLSDQPPGPIAGAGDVLYVTAREGPTGGRVDAYRSDCWGNCPLLASVALPGQPEEISVSDGRVHVVSGAEPEITTLTAYGLP